MSTVDENKESIVSYLSKYIKGKFESEMNIILSNKEHSDTVH